MSVDLLHEIEKIKKCSGIKISGRVVRIVGLLIESIGPQVCLGEICYLYARNHQLIPCEVVGFKDQSVLLMSLGEMSQLTVGSEVYPSGNIHTVAVAESMCGRIVDALGNPIDNKGPLIAEKYYPVMASPPDPLSRNRISSILHTGVKAIDALCTTGQGQRMGIFSGSGVGKSTLMSMIAKMSSADINVIALIGERGREVREFIEKDLGPEGLARSVIIVATSDQAALLRAKGACVATAIAEYFRDIGKNVVLIMDSITRYAMALREIGLAVGEPPTTKGYTPSVFALLPKLLERAGNSEKGSITGIYTILAEADDMNDPIADTARSILDGHIVLSRKLAASNHFPAIDVLESLSRVMIDIVSNQQYEQAGRLRDLLQVYKESEDLINLGAYVNGSNPKIDQAINMIHSMRSFLKQKAGEHFSFDQTEKQLNSLIKI